MVVSKIKLANKKYKHEARRKQKRQLEKAKSLKEKQKASSHRKHQQEVDRLVSEMKAGYVDEA